MFKEQGPAWLERGREVSARGDEIVGARLGRSSRATGRIWLLFGVKSGGHGALWTKKHESTTRNALKDYSGCCVKCRLWG